MIEYQTVFEYLKSNHFENIAFNGIGIWDTSMSCRAEHITQSWGYVTTLLVTVRM
jgi:hypothetical protein